MITFSIVMVLIVFTAVVAIFLILKSHDGIRALLITYVSTMAVGIIAIIVTVSISPNIIRNKLDEIPEDPPEIYYDCSQEALKQLYEMRGERYRKMPELNKWLDRTKRLVETGLYWDVGADLREEILNKRSGVYIYYEDGKYVLTFGGYYSPED